MPPPSPSPPRREVVSLASANGLPTAAPPRRKHNTEAENYRKPWSEEAAVPDEVLGAGESVTCWPTRGAGLLARARGLGDRGASPAEVAETLNAALQVAEGEVRAQRLALCYLAGRVLKTGLETLGLETTERM